MKSILPLILVHTTLWSQPRPNILFIMSDDHTTQAFGCYGSRLASLDPTPHLDQIASEGMLFENCFVTNSICTPSRATIMTGQYSQTNGVLDLDGRLSAERQFLPQEMSSLGYHTVMLGKWHLKDEPSAFDHYMVLPGQGSYFDPTFRVRGELPWKENTVQRKGHSSDVITDLAQEWLEQDRPNDRPFFMMLHYKAPHDMFEFAPRYSDYLEDIEIPEPASLYYNGDHGSSATRGNSDSLVHVIGSSVSHRNTLRNMGMHMDIDQSISDPEYSHLAYQEYLKRYLRCVKGIDDNIGELIQTLKSMNLYDNTIIIYTGDQGFMLGEHDYIDKRWMYEESLRMPFLVRYPMLIAPGQHSRAIINNADFAPTILQLAGGTPPEYMQGNGFLSILTSGEEPDDWPQATYYRYWMHMAHRHANPAHFGIRTKNHKLVFFYGRYWVDTDSSEEWNKKSWGNNYSMHTPPGWEFYDLSKDPFEMDNRYDEIAYEGIIKDLKAQLKEMREDLNETDQAYPHLQRIIDANWD